MEKFRVMFCSPQADGKAFEQARRIVLAALKFTEGAPVKIEIEAVPSKENAELREKLRRFEWQDISTAPKDGREVLLWHPHREEVELGYWMNYAMGWRYEETGNSDQFTHWMPLPSPPKQEGE